MLIGISVGNAVSRHSGCHLAIKLVGHYYHLNFLMSIFPDPDYTIHDCIFVGESLFVRVGINLLVMNLFHLLSHQVIQTKFKVYLIQYLIHVVIFSSEILR